MIVIVTRAVIRTVINSFDNDDSKPWPPERPQSFLSCQCALHRGEHSVMAGFWMRVMRVQGLRFQIYSDLIGVSLPHGFWATIPGHTIVMRARHGFLRCM